MARAHEFSAKVRKEAYARSGGRCEGMLVDGKWDWDWGERCIMLFDERRPEYDHIIPVALRGRSDLDNCAVLCRFCHRLKTSTSDVPAISKAQRILEKRLGIRKSQWPMRKR